jgi:hypothetical protein
VCRHAAVDDAGDPRTRKGGKSIAGSMIGGIAETQEVIDYCVVRNIKANIELVRADQINQAYDRVVKKDVRYRFVIDKRELNMEIKGVGSQPSSKGPADWFTGTVRIDPLFQANAPARATGASVTFEPGARTAWHTHPLGQTLIVTSGCGLVQRWEGPVRRFGRAT